MLGSMSIIKFKILNQENINIERIRIFFDVETMKHDFYDFFSLQDFSNLS